MNQNAMHYSDNDINVAAKSTLHMTLCLRGATGLVPQGDMSSASPRPLPSREASHDRRIETPRNPPSPGPVHESGWGRLTFAPPSLSFSYWASMLSEEEFPTFLFGRHSQDHINSKIPKVVANKSPIPEHWAWGGSATGLSEEESEPEYDSATKMDSNQHLNWSTATHIQHSTPQEARNPAHLEIKRLTRCLEESSK
ncbi:hypothetical protein Z517_05953 [Fonsecaea pedrosoi CBS 271.37]|uniref:Uncharacterized protein n=1 Tax=Fonsecaea pedrosoi CBS 271.37 TaxID=1442368 RepID=A0A0D2DNM8_9EURO|nr:uncharacterized protein Z517_05953 [Fonsecaea pedrosoi CBS 271.37]KIW79341.1 hypothetical protein Z517_05953 [Fonsecaea pedrosoi CBS 271.37]